MWIFLTILYLCLGAMCMCIRCEVKGEYINFFGEYDDPKESSKNMLMVVFWPIYLVFYIIKGIWWFVYHFILSFKILVEALFTYDNNRKNV